MCTAAPTRWVSETVIKGGLLTSRWKTALDNYMIAAVLCWLFVHRKRKLSNYIIALLIDIILTI